MSLSGLPTPERRTATLVLLALGVALGLGLARTLIQEFRPPAQVQTAPEQSRLMAVLEGVMAGNVTPAERDRFEAWVDGGATREGFAPVEVVVANNCASCHGEGKEFPRIQSFEDLQPLALEPVPSVLAELASPRMLHLLGFPLLFLVAIRTYLRRSTWPGRKAWMGVCAGAILFDVAQWWLRQGRAEAPWAAGTAAALLALAYLVLAAMTLKEFWKTQRKSA